MQHHPENPPQLGYERSTGEGRAPVPVLAMGFASILCLPVAFVVAVVVAGVVQKQLGMSASTTHTIASFAGLLVLVVGAVVGFMGDRYAARTRHRMQRGMLWLATIGFYLNTLMFILFVAIWLANVLA